MVKNTIIKAEKDYAPAELLDLATNYRDTLDGKLASLLNSNNEPTADDALSSDEIFSQNNSINVALWITALTTPFSRTGQRLKESFIFFRSRGSQSTDNQEVDPENKLKALKIIKGQPL